MQASLSRNKPALIARTRSQDDKTLSFPSNKVTSLVNMSSTHATSGASSASPPAPPKLKSSCDMCSVSKVRCESQKPVCSRCSKLGHPCSYSIARRVGRRHGSRRAQEHPAEPRQVPGADSGRQATSSRSYGRFAAQPSGVPSLAPLRPSASTGGPPGTGEGGPSSSSHGPKPKIPGPRPSDDLPRDVWDVPTTSPPLLSDGQGAQPPCGQTTSSSVASNGRRSVGSIMSVSIEASSSAALDGPGDCAGTAMALQEQLEYGNKRLSNSLPAVLGGGSGRFPSELMRSVDSALETLSSACNRLSTVLICTCSERLDVGLLVATVCISMLDMCDAIISSSAASSAESTGASAGSDGDDAFRQWNFLNFPTNSQKRKASIMDLDREPPAEGNSILVRVFDELPKVASLVLQFSKRYKVANAPDGAITGSSDLLYALASYARVRLQNVKNEATGRLQGTL